MQKGHMQNIDCYRNVINFTKSRELNMLRKISEEFNFDKYILWIISDIYIRDENVTVGAIKVITKEKEELSMNYVQSNPYPNRKIHQLSGVPRDKRKKVFGIPLFFDTFEELNKIEKIIIDWYVLAPHGDALDIIHSEYSVDFIYDSNNKIYTMQTKDYLQLGKDVGEGTANDYINEFDSFNIYVSENQQEFRKECLEQKYLYIQMLKSENQQENTYIGEPNIPTIKEILSNLPEKIDYSIVSSIDLIVHYYYMRSHEKLVAHEIATILTESSFGFSD